VPRRNIMAQIAGFAGFLLVGGAIVLLASLVVSVKSAFHQTDAGIGLMFFWASVGYGLGGYSTGHLARHMSLPRLLAAAALLACLGSIVELAAPSWPLFLGAALITNVGTSIVDAGTNALFIDLFPNSRGGALNLLHGCVGLGALIVPLPVGALLVGGLNWRVTFAAFAVAYLIVAVLYAAARIPEGPKHDPAATEVEIPARGRLPLFGLALGIALYIACELSISNWVVAYLAGSSTIMATRTLSGFWIGMTAGRMASFRLAERLDYGTFTVGCLLAGAGCEVIAVVTPAVVVKAVAFGLAGLFYAPIYPMIMAVGGTLYPRSASRLSGTLTFAGVCGGISYPPLMGVMAGAIGIGGGMVGAAILAVPASAAIFAAWRSRRVAVPVGADG